MDLIQHVVVTGEPSCVFCAYTRFGKTKAAEYARARLPEAFPDTPIVSFHAHAEKQPTVRKFFSLLLSQSGYVLKGTKPYDNIREQLVRAWFTEAQARESPNLIFLGDEMQKLQADEFSWLIDVSNDLEQLGVRMTAILFAQPDLINFRSYCLRYRRGDILGRFLTRWHSFDGIESPDELRRVLECFDDPDQADFPNGSRICFTEFFLPIAYECGWRLASCAGALWELFAALIESTSKRRPKNRISIGMQWIVHAVKFALTHYADQDRKHFAIAKDQWKSAVDSTGIVHSVGVTYDPAWGMAHEQLKRF